MRFVVACVLAAFLLGTFQSKAVAEVKYDKKWSYNKQKGYHFKKCEFPNGGHQYLIYYESKSTWVSIVVGTKSARRSLVCGP